MFIFVDAQLVGVMGKAHNFLCLIISSKAQSTTKLSNAI